MNTTNSPDTPVLRRQYTKPLPPQSKEEMFENTEPTGEPLTPSKYPTLTTNPPTLQNEFDKLDDVV